MFRSKTLVWITFAFCVTTGSCAELYEKVGDEAKMNCYDAGSSGEFEWKLNNALLFSMQKSGRHRKGSSDTSLRTRIEGNTLKISSLKSIDSGVYVCKSSRYTLYVASAHANPSTVLYSGETKLSCDVSGGSKSTFHWFTPEGKPDGREKEVTLKHVTSAHAGLWTCEIKNETHHTVKVLKVNINVVGPLITPEDVRISEGDNVELPCFVPTVSGPSIKKGSWTYYSPSGVCLPKLMWKSTAGHWNKTGVNTDKWEFSVQNLKTHFNVSLTKVRTCDAGVYVCSLKFEGGESLSANLTLTVLKKDGSAHDMGSEGSTKVPKNTWNKLILGMQLWIWITVSVLFLVLIILVVIGLLIYCRNKRMKKKMKKLNSMRKPRNYCMCDRAKRQTDKSPGKKERPPPLPRHQYSSLNE